MDRLKRILGYLLISGGVIYLIVILLGVAAILGITAWILAALLAGFFQ